MANIYTGPGNYKDLGFQTFYHPFTYLANDPNKPDFAVYTPPPDQDPRGIPNGILPSQQIAYRIYNQTIDTVTDNATPDILAAATVLLGTLGGGAGVIPAMGMLVPVLLTATQRVCSAMTFFEGTDHIDVPIESLTMDGDQIVFPTPVYRVFHAGSSKLVPDAKTSVQKAVTIAYETFGTSDNDAVSIVPSDLNNLPIDAKMSRILNSGSKWFVDTMSNRVRVKGTPRYVSYTSIDKYLFRDYVFTKVGTLISGFGNFLLGIRVTGTDFLSSDFYTLRYVPVNIAGIGQPEKLIWRLSESFGRKNILKEATPSTLSVFSASSTLSSEQKQRASLDETHNHFAYNIAKESIATAPNGNFFLYENYSPIGDAYSPTFAKAKIDKTSPYYDKNFKAQIFDYALGFGAPGGSVSVYSLPLSQESDSKVQTKKIAPEFSYTSPSWLSNFTSKTRVGWEYTFNSGTGSNWPTATWASRSPPTTIVLLRSNPTKQTLSAIHDCCSKKIILYENSPISGNTVLTERYFDDLSWETSWWTKVEIVLGTPESKTQCIFAGEFPFRTGGRVLLHPPQVSFGLTAKDSVPTYKLATALLVGLSGKTPKVWLKKGQDIVFEAVYPLTLEQSGNGYLLSIPPTQYDTFEGEGATLVDTFGVNINDAYLPKFGDAKPTKTKIDPGAAQRVVSDALSFPSDVASCSAVTECLSSRIFIAFETQNTVNILVRACSGYTCTIRDVVLRFPKKGITVKTANDLPTAGDVVVCSDNGTKTLLFYYVYKHRLWVKKISWVVFDAYPPTPQDALPVDQEVEIQAMLQQTPSDLIYDGDENKSDDITLDAESKFIRITTDGRPQNAAKTFISYDACVMPNGTQIAILAKDKSTLIRRSSNGGTIWTNITGETFTFLATKNAKGQDLELQAIDSPKMLYVDETAMYVFFIYSSAVCYIKIAPEILALSPEQAEKELAKCKPYKIFGDMTQDMIDRGFVSVQTEKVIGSTAEKRLRIPSQRISAIMSGTGSMRVFFRDDEAKLHSLSSPADARTWIAASELDYKES